MILNLASPFVKLASPLSFGNPGLSKNNADLGPIFRKGGKGESSLVLVSTSVICPFTPNCIRDHSQTFCPTSHLPPLWRSPSTLGSLKSPTCPMRPGVRINAMKGNPYRLPVLSISLAQLTSTLQAPGLLFTP